MKSRQPIYVSLMALLAVFLFHLPAAYAEENVFTLDEVKSAVINHSREVEKNRVSLDKAKYKYKQAEYDYNNAATPSSYYTYLNLSNQYSELNAKFQNGDPDVTQDNLDDLQEQIDSALDRMESEASKRDSLYDSMESAETAYNDAEKDQQKFFEELRYTVEQRCLDILLQENKISILQKELELKNLQLNFEKVRLGFGSSSKANADKLHTETLNLSKSLLDAENNLKNQIRKINDMMGREINSELKIAPIEAPDLAVVPTYDEISSDIIRNYSGLNRLKRDIDQKEDDFDSTYSFSGYTYSIKSLEIQEMKLQLKDEEHKLSETINNFLINLESKQKNFQLIKTEFENAKKQFEWNKARYDIGQLSKLKLFQSELDFLNAKNKYESNQYDLYLAQKNLELMKQGVIKS